MQLVPWKCTVLNIIVDDGSFKHFAHKHPRIVFPRQQRIWLLYIILYSKQTNITLQNINLSVLSGKTKTFSVQNISPFGSNRRLILLLGLRLIVVSCVHSYGFGFGLQLRWWTPMRSGLNFRPQFSHATRLSRAVWKAASFTAARSYEPVPVHEKQCNEVGLLTHNINTI